MYGHDRQEGPFKHTTKARNAIIIVVDMSFSVHATNKARNIYVMGKDFIQGIDDTNIYAEKNFRTNFTDSGKKFILSLHYNGSNSYLFVNGYQELKFTEKNANIPKRTLNIDNLSSDWNSVDVPKTSMFGDIFDVVVDYELVNSVKAIYVFIDF